MKFFLLDFLNRMSCKNRKEVMLVNIFFKIFLSFSKFGLNALLGSERYIVRLFIFSRQKNGKAVENQ